ncbi:hypothetical protein [Streptomyces sp. OE57]|uniref:hypothetical protein n=1 Tax=Streptomyces lacaronensis TaxID=3379885 RepID=UPI0039B75F5A
MRTPTTASRRPGDPSQPRYVDQADQRVPGRAGRFFQRGTDGLGDVFQPGRVALY